MRKTVVAWRALISLAVIPATPLATLPNGLTKLITSIPHEEEGGEA